MDWLPHLYFYFCAALAVMGAVGTVVSRNPIRGAMGLMLMILSVAGLFLALHAQFLAAIQLIVYAGAIVVLFLFVIMLLGPDVVSARDRRGQSVRASSAIVFLLCAINGIVVLTRGMKVHALHAAPRDFGGIDAFGRVLFSDAIVPFELSSALLMVAIVGAIAVARGNQPERNAKSAGSSAPARIQANRAQAEEFASREDAPAHTVPTGAHS